MPTTDRDVQAYVVRFVQETLNQRIDPSKVDGDTPLGPGGLDLESLAFIELTLGIEKQFGVVTPDDQLEAIAGMTLGRFGDYVAQRARPADAAV